MIRFPDGSVRYLTTREAARLVGLPDEYEFPRSWTESMRQMGNAVPTPLAEAAGRHLRAALERGWSAARAARVAAE
jgi:DNA (cytosine-5)-methyltransferase 1